MDTAQRIRKLGFKRWYERQLVQSFAYLVTCFLGIILVAAAMELLGEAPSFSDKMLQIGLAAVGSATVLASWKLHAKTLLLAESLAAGATCPTCHIYAAFGVIASGPRAAIENESGDEAPWLRVRCSRCSCEWVIDSEKAQ